MKTDTPSARSARHSASMHNVAKLLLAFLILLIVNYIGFKHYTHKDLSASQFYTLSPKTVEELKKLDSPLTIYTYLNPKNPPQAEQIANLLKEYQTAGGKNVVVEKIDPNFDAARANELDKKLHFADSNDFLVIFQFKDRAPRFVKQQDLYDVNPMTGESTGFKGEQQITAAIIALIEGQASKVYFTTGHGEFSPQDASTGNGYGLAGQSIKNENAESLSLNLGQKGEIPADADAVVIAGPKVAFSPVEVQALDSYLTKNGKLFVLVDPYVQSGLDDLLKKYGLKFESDITLYRFASPDGTQMTAPLVAIYQAGFSSHPITAKFGQSGLQILIQLPTRSITLLPDDKGQPNPKTQFLLQTDENAWGWVNTTGVVPPNPRQLTYDKTTDIKGPITFAAVYDGGSITDPATKATVTAARIVAVGSAKFLDNDNYDGTVSANFFTNCIDWLVKKDAVLDIAPKKPQEYGVSLSPASYSTTVWFALLIVPGTAFLMGIFTWFSRRK